MLRHARFLLLCFALGFAGACSKDEPPISVTEGMVTLVNSTEEDWSEVLITVNDHYRGYIPVLKAEGRANAPLSQMTTGHGQRWVQGRRAEKIVVTGKKADGSPLELTWEVGQERRLRERP
jgi:hypothetical protein